MSKHWFSAQELLGSPGVPGTLYGIRKKAESESWEKRPRETGKGFEYHISSLPSAAIAHLAESFVLESEGERSAKELVAELEAKEAAEKRVVFSVSAEAMRQVNMLPEKNRALAMARLAIVEIRDNFLRAFEGRISEGHRQFVEAFKRKTLPLDESVYGVVKSISRATVDRWYGQLREGGVMSLAPPRSPRRGDSVIANQPDLEKFCIVLLVARPHFKSQPSKMREYAMVQKEKEGADWKIPAISSFARWIKQWLDANEVEYAYYTNPKKFNGEEKPLIHKQSQWVSRPNDLWELDSTPTDVMLRVGDKLVRHSIVGCIDVFTRRVKLILAPTSTAEAVGLCLRKAILDWGLPNEDAEIKTDNGSDYVAKKTVNLIRALGVKHVKATPFAGWEKPYIERFFRTFQGGIVEMMPNYIGHNVQDRELIEARNDFAARIGEGKKKRYEDALNIGMTPEEFQAFMDDWLEHYYHQRAHSGLDGLSPYQQYTSAKYKPVVLSDPHALDMLLNHAGVCTVIRGGVQVDGLVYRAPELMETRYLRQRANVYIDPCDVSKAYLYMLEGDGECIEAVNADLIGLSIPAAPYRERRKKEKKALVRGRREVQRLEKELGIDGLAAELIVQAKRRNNMVEFPHETAEHNNPVLKALELAGIKPSTEYSAAELEAIERSRETRQQRAEREAEVNSKRLKSEQEIAWDYAQILVDGGELEPRQQEWFNKYLRSHQLIAVGINKFIQSGGKTRRMVK